MDGRAAHLFRITPKYEALFARLGLTAESVFTDPRIKVWRSIAERENCTLDVDGGARLHVKRYHAVRTSLSPAEEESRGIEALEAEGIATTPLVAYGRLADGRSFMITEDLAGYRAADKWITDGFPFEKLLEPTADLAARLHGAGLHHRDLYLCHFFFKPATDGGLADLRLIDAARVKRLPGFITRRRWIVKDLAQFWYSTRSLPVSDDQRGRWLDRYGVQRGLDSVTGLRRSIERKVERIARHDARLRGAQPSRNVSIPGA